MNKQRHCALRKTPSLLIIGVARTGKSRKILELLEDKIRIYFCHFPCHFLYDVRLSIFIFMEVINVTLRLVCLCKYLLFEMNVKGGIQSRM